jgi:hypothetical protein
MFKGAENSLGATRRNLRARLKILKKIIGTYIQPIRTKKNPKKVCLVSEKCKGAKNSYGYGICPFGALKKIRLKKTLTSKRVTIFRFSVHEINTFIIIVNRK